MINHPGVILEEKLMESGMSRKELAQRIDVSEKHISTVVNGQKGISSAFANKLGYVFDNPKYWVDLQAEYDNEQARLREENSISKEEIKLLKNLKEIIQYFSDKGYIDANSGEASIVMQLRAFLKVSDLLLIPNITYNAAYRAQVSSNATVDPYVLFAWQMLCERETEGVEIKNELNKELLKSKLNEIKSMMFGDINEGIASLQKIFSDCGIAFGVIKNFRGAPVQGFIKEKADNKLLLCLTIRRQRADIFWFTLFHEIAHILFDDYSKHFVDFNSAQSEVEARADTFAANALIEPESYREFILSDNCTSLNGIKAFASKENVKPFVVIGRLQKDGILDWSDFNNYLVQYSWA